MSQNTEDILQARGEKYGRFVDQATVVVQLKSIIHERLAERQIAVAVDQLEAIYMICHKLGRIANGDPNYADSWLDIAGYATLVADRLEGEAK